MYSYLLELVLLIITEVDYSAESELGSTGGTNGLTLEPKSIEEGSTGWVGSTGSVVLGSLLDDILDLFIKLRWGL